jgi:hypothetical protein
MLSRIVLAVLVGVITTLACVLVGGILVSLGVAIAVTIGGFLVNYSGVLGVIAALWYFFSNQTWPNRG